MPVGWQHFSINFVFNPPSLPLGTQSAMDVKCRFPGACVGQRYREGLMNSPQRMLLQWYLTHKSTLLHHTQAKHEYITVSNQIAPREGDTGHKDDNKHDCEPDLDTVSVLFVIWFGCKAAHNIWNKARLVFCLRHFSFFSLTLVCWPD